ncbi:hypothetical protein TVAG_309120 [Trichomonas vaginalis G3]|uniref:HECT domain-containing protein n=1 Tax=Trichomonas vaginalis (strain ATCC PRA-98 / G3) TaxID=412133 RepID=A2EDQ8_TRIV3|nr:guanyl-nucleotide exchange factor protein [Trichomonas vaginalis G3]EAY09223.1 hypothetical protein TVAG_309120 [Trichomonas vaginalis G3]KAI5486804.1 guanyl-nucleotide exchange factor protein [Trichomonas vaginalis G3]|eukprot:XP_001321446.1 hypothetical protein [Trichomonas vaginalis G3]
MFTPWNFCLPKSGGKIATPTFSQILDSIEESISSLSNSKVNLNNINTVVNYFQAVTAPSALPPPSKEFFPKNSSGHSVNLSTKFTAYHGMASNGKFIFLLVAEGQLQIFPLFNHGALTNPLIRQLNSKFGTECSLLVVNENLHVYFGKQVYIYSIAQILSNTEELVPRIENVEKNYIAIVSNGITHACVESNFLIHLYQTATNKLIRSVQLKAGNNTLSKELKDLFPTTDYHQIPMIINGPFIGFFYRVQPTMTLLRVFSLITGEHILDDNYSCTEQFYTLMNDIYSQSIWAVVGPRLCLKRFYFAGSYDPQLFAVDYVPANPSKVKLSNCFIQFAGALQKNLIHLIGSQIIPKTLLPEKDHFAQTERLIDMLMSFLATTNGMKMKEKIAKYKDVMVQNMVIILDLNLKGIELADSKQPTIVNKVFDVMTFLQPELRTFLFFNHLKFFMFAENEEEVSDFALSMMCSFLEKLTSDELIHWALSKVASSRILQQVTMMRDNALKSLIPTSTKIPPPKPIFSSLLVIHQHAMIRIAHEKLKNDPFLPLTVPDNELNPTNPLHNLGVYLNFIIQRLDSAISEVESAEELANSVIFRLFKNLVDCICCLTRFHTVAQLVTKLFHVLLAKIGQFFARIEFNAENDSNPLSDLIRVFLFLFSQFAATLVKGGVLSVFEERFIWLVRANISIVDKYNLQTITQEEFEPLENPKINEFLEGKIDVMTLLYKKFKPLQNKNLKENIKKLDRLSVIAFAIHTNAVDDLLSLSEDKTISGLLRKCIEQMFRIRNTVRELIQNGKEEEVKVIEERIRMLIRMKSNFDGIENPSLLLGDFVLCDTTPSRIMKILAQQRSRIQTTLVGFNLIDDTYNMAIHPQYNDIISFTLSKIERFDGLSTIIKMTPIDDAQKHQIEQFFHRILKLIQDDCNTDKWILVAYRFFRDIEGFEDIKRFFLDGILQAFTSNPTRFSLFALCFALIPSINELPSALANVNHIQPIRYILLSEALKYIDCPLDLFQQFDKVFWTIKPDFSRLTCRTMFHMLSSKLIPDEEVERIIAKMIHYIGEHSLLNTNIPFCNEMTWTLRRMIQSHHRAEKIIKSIIQKLNPESDENDICGALTIIGSYSEKIRPYCNIKYHYNRNSVFECIAIQPVVEEKGMFYYCFHRPFNILSPSIQVKITPETMIYAVPMIILDPKEFDLDFILSFFDYAFSNASKVTQSVYMQVLALYCNETNFVMKLNETHMSKLVECPLPFSDISYTLTEIEKFSSMRVLPPPECCFSAMKYKDNEYTSYISPQILPDAEPFTIKLKTPPGQMNCFVGIISSCVDKHHTRYSLVSIPDGQTYPVPLAPQLHLEENVSELEITFDIKNSKFMIGTATYFFPEGKAFKIIVAQHKTLHFDADVPDANKVFDRFATPPQIQRGCIDFDEETPLFTIPTWATEDVNLPHDISKMTKSTIYIGRLTPEEKMMSNFVPPPKYISIHIGFTTEASQALINEQVRGLYKQLALQWSTIVLMRILLIKQEMITSERLMMKLVSLLTVMLEGFVPSEFELQKFPFSLSVPIWSPNAQANILYMGFEMESLKALKLFVQRPQFISALCKGLQAMNKSERMHLVARPCRSHHYFAPPKDGENPILWKEKPIDYKCGSNCIVAPNDFNGFLPESICFKSSGTKQLYPTPAIIPLSQPPHIIVLQGQNRREFSVFDINPMNNTWVYDTPFEMLLLLKNFVFVAQTDEERAAAKRILLECFIMQSPFIYNYLPQFADLMQLQIPITPFDENVQYRQLLAVTASLLQDRKDYVSQRFLILYLHDQHVLTSTENRRLAMYFPEFFTKKFDPPEDDQIVVPEAIIDPGAIKGNFPGYILRLRQFARQYKSLEGFPFWEILPMWFRLSGTFKGDGDFIAPTLTVTSPTSCHVANPSKVQIEIKFVKSGKISRGMYLFRSTNAEFDNPTIIAENNVKDVIVTSEPDLFFSIIGNKHDTFNVLKPQMTSLVKKPVQEKKKETNKISISSIRSRFIDDMHQFAIDWSPADTEELITILPRISLREPTFAAIENISKGCSICSKFSPTVVMLHALLIHHFNYIRYNFFKSVPQNIWNSMTSFLSAEDAADAITSQIIVSPETLFPSITIDRHAAHRLITNGNGDPYYSIISQLTRVIRNIEHFKLCCKKKPWKVTFVGEMAVDAGGPGRELLTEAAASIFEPTTLLAISTPNMRNHTGQYKDVYIPFDKTMSRLQDYYTIGVLLGIIIRTGLQQDLPFAPIVWKFIANEHVGIDDVTAIDSGLLEHFNHIRSVSNDADFAQHYAFQWKVDDWDGTKVSLPGHDKGDILNKEDVEQYIKECVDYRLNSILPLLREMKAAFRRNTGFKHNALLTGALLSRMAQGSGDISVQHLKQITHVSDFEDGIKNEYVKRFFRAVDRLNKEQKKLLLKFITTLTRLPNSTLNPDFKLKIDLKDCPKPDEMLPTASTCFNKLHLPKYSTDEICYQKLLIAIQYCQTMEIK